MKNMENNEIEYVSIKSRIQGIKNSIKNDKKKVINLKYNKELFEKSKSIISESIYEIQSNFKFNIENTINSVINYIWDEFNYEFKIEPKEKLSGFEWQPMLFEDGNELDLRKDDGDVGGGLISTIGFCFKVIFHLMKTNKMRNILFFDEPVANLGDLTPKFGDMVQHLSDKFGTQFIIATHDERLLRIANKKYQIKRIGKKSRVKQIYN